MAPIRGRGGFRGRGRGRFPGRGGRKGGFAGARVEEPVADAESSGSDIGDVEAEDASDISEDISDEEEEDQPPTVRPYNALLQAFQQSEEQDKPRKKRRKLDHEFNLKEETRSISPEIEEDQQKANGPIDQEDLADLVDEEDLDEDEDSTDPFERHFANPDENELSQRLKAIVANQWTSQKIASAKSGRLIFSSPGKEQGSLPKKIKSIKDLKIKQRLVSNAQDILGDFSPSEQEILPYTFEYQDILFGARTVRNAGRLRQITCLHALNHIFKTRDRVIKNNAKQAKGQDDEDTEYRDQGFTRPKVLFLTETRQAAVRMVEAMTELCDFEQQENRKRFFDAFSQPEDKFSEDKPEDFRELFEGNDDNEFRLGLKFTRKTLKFFSKFYNSDIILASPLGLRRAIESGGPKKKDYDFLSSIELVIMDQADAILMQNWDHVEFVFDHLNLQPKDAHGCDFSRVRSWYLDGNAANLRQTIVLSAYLTPELNSLFSKYMRNVSGKTKFQPDYDGAITNIGLQVKQTFSRYDSPVLTNDPDARFKYFTTAIIPALTRIPKPAEGGQGVLIFIPSYLDFVRTRNYFAGSNATENISFGAISEYVDMPDVRRARSHFMTGRHSVLLYTGRAHHFRRYNIRGVKRVIMYSLPDNPVFYHEIVGGYLGLTLGEGKIDSSETSVKVLFSKWDGLRLERVVGTKRVGAMLRDKGGDTFDFV